MTKEDHLKVFTCLVMVMEDMAHRKYLLRGEHVVVVLAPTQQFYSYIMARTKYIR